MAQLGVPELLIILVIIILLFGVGRIGKVAGEFRAAAPARVVTRGPVRTIAESVLRRSYAFECLGAAAAVRDPSGVIVEINEACHYSIANHAEPARRSRSTTATSSGGRRPDHTGRPAGPCHPRTLPLRRGPGGRTLASEVPEGDTCSVQ